MQRFKKILFVTGEEPFTHVAFSKSLGFALRNHATITAMDVVDAIPQRRRTFETANGRYDLQELLVADARERLARLLDSAEYNTRSVPEAVVAAGERHIEIISRVLKAEHDLVIIADAEEGYDATTHHILRKAPCPVWLMTPSIDNKQRILAAVDPDPLRPIQELLNDDVLTLAVSLASMENAPLHIVHAWNTPGGAWAGVSISDQKAYRDQTLERHRESLEQLLERHRIPDDTVVHFLEGRPDKAIRQVVLRRNITTIVMGTVARSGIPGLIIGNTAERILRSVSCSVIAVKPQGFETPVRLP